MPAQFAAVQSCAVVSDGHFHAAVYSLTDGGTEDWADTWDSATMTYDKASDVWFGAYIYDYESAAWTCALYACFENM